MNLFKIFKTPIIILMIALAFLLIILWIIISNKFITCDEAYKNILLNLIPAFLTALITLVLVDLSILGYQERARLEKRELGVKQLRRLLNWLYVHLRFICLLVEKKKSLGEPKALKEAYTINDLKTYFDEINAKIAEELPFKEGDEKYKSGFDFNDFFASLSTKFADRAEEILDRYFLSFEATIIENIEKLINSDFIHSATMYYRHPDIAKEINYTEYASLPKEIKQFLLDCLRLEEHLADLKKQGK